MPATAKAPTLEQKKFLDDCREAFMDMCLAAGVTEDQFEKGDAAEVCDRVIAWWHAQEDADRPPLDAAGSILGVAFGDLLLSAYTTFSWRWIADGPDGALGLWQDKPRAFVAPLDAALRELEEGNEAFAGPVLDALAASLERQLKGLPPDEDED
jgi:hypothetical protein